MQVWHGGKLLQLKGGHKANPEALRSSENWWILVQLSYWVRLKYFFFFCKGPDFQTQNLWDQLGRDCEKDFPVAKPFEIPDLEW